jgi:hypothetical protein
MLTAEVRKIMQILGTETSYRVAQNVIKKDCSIQVDLEAWLMVGREANENGLEIQYV